MTRASESLDSVDCNLCGADDYEVLWEAGVAQLSQVVRCRSCGLMYANPRAVDPDCEDVGSWAVDGALDWEGDHPALRWNRVRRRKESLQIADYADTRAELRELYPERGHLVEVGSGLGFLSAAFSEDGWTVTAVEPWAEACLHAEKLGVNRAIPAILEEANIPDGSVDVLVMLHVIEHVPDPTATLKEIYRVLKPGGRLVLETPRCDGTVSKLLGHRERNIRCNGHIYFFGAPQMAQMSKNAGFQVEGQRFVGRSLTFGRLGFNVSQILGSERMNVAVEQLTDSLDLDRFSLNLNIHDMQRLLLRRPPQAPVEAGRAAL